MFPPFAGPDLKIKRARRHIQEVEDAVAAYKAARPFSLQVWKGPTKERLRVSPRVPVPSELPAIIGDAVHNTRVALDLMANDAVRVVNGIPEPDVRFPFAKYERDFDEMVKRAKLGAARPDIIKMMRETKPWQGTIRVIHELDIVDKHQMILPTFAMLTTNQGCLGCGVNGLADFPSEISIYGLEEEMEEVHSAALEDEMNASLKLIFRARHWQPQRADIEVTGDLHKFADFVEGLVQTFKAHCLGPD